MIDVDSDYSRLLPFRDAVFPTFDADQERAASIVSAAVLKSQAGQRIGGIIDLGCGTAEISGLVRREMVKALGRGVKCLGVDRSSAEIAVARELRTGCEFVEQRAEAFVKSLGEGQNSFSPHNTLVLCVGHTIPHFHEASEFLDNISMWRPTLLLIDFYENWDAVVQHFEAPGAAPLRQVKHSYRSSTGNLVTHTLTTKRHPEDPERIVRGIETSYDGKPGTADFWTTQLRRGSGWFLRTFMRHGYAVDRTLTYTGGYGPMQGFLLARAL